MYRRASNAFIRWTFLCLGLATLGAVIGANLYQVRDDLTKREEERLLFLTGIVQKITEENLVALDAVLSDLIRDQVQGDVDRDINQRLVTLTDALPGVRTLTVLDAQGVVRACNRPELLGRDLSQREYFQRARTNPASETLHVSQPFQTFLGVYSINLGKVVLGAGGQFAGLVVATLDPQFFIPLLNSVLFSPDMRAFMTHGEGLLFLMAPEREGMAGLDLALPGSFFSRHRESGQEASVFMGTTPVTAEERMLAIRTIRPASLKMDNSLVVAVDRDPSRIYGQWRKDALLQGGLYVAAVLVSVFGFGIYQRQRRRHEQAMAEAHRNLEDSERFIRMVTDNIPGMVAYWDRDLRCKYGNMAYQEWFGRSMEDMRGISLREVLGEVLFQKNEPHIMAALKGEPQVFERVLTKPDGNTRDIQVSYIPDVDGMEVKGFFVLGTDITELKYTQLELERRVRELDILAATDPLTGIGNRRHFLERAEDELARSKRYSLPLVFLMVDIDHFKSINDTYGHDTGDDVLKSMASTLQHTMRATDIVGRLGGEEFGVLLIQTGTDEALVIAERLLKTLQSVCVLTKTGSICYTVSIGLSAFEVEDDSMESLMKRADLALYHAKETGRNRVCCFGDF
ncbi:diguanylate cyclase [Fundidesulfovibrio putealis]|uniref:diguanylate cyclase n=1 Tax=Fundidesulfovibrio putealis TaxID=270496 RepID=UPI00146FA8EF|nr:diguanylate cyclase [Fundidesulfovibrio putealis]